MVKNKIYNKTFWIITMFILPNIAIIFYLIQRNKLLRLGQKFSYQTLKKNDCTTKNIEHTAISCKYEN